MLPLGEETAVQAVVGSIVWAFPRLKKPRCREMSARGYAPHSVCLQLSFFSFTVVFVVSFCIIAIHRLAIEKLIKMIRTVILRCKDNHIRRETIEKVSDRLEQTAMNALDRITNTADPSPDKVRTRENI